MRVFKLLGFFNLVAGYSIMKKAKPFSPDPEINHIIYQQYDNLGVMPLVDYDLFSGKYIF